tara:strand:- start:12 stop:173 length:162 start_codon:yes stop_codon:yes gene_type:complete
MIRPIVLELYNESIENIRAYLSDTEAPDEVFEALGVVMGMVELQDKYIRKDES